MKSRVPLILKRCVSELACELNSSIWHIKYKIYAIKKVRIEHNITFKPIFERRVNRTKGYRNVTLRMGDVITIPNPLTIKIKSITSRERAHYVLENYKPGVTIRTI